MTPATHARMLLMKSQRRRYYRHIVRLLDVHAATLLVWGEAIYFVDRRDMLTESTRFLADCRRVLGHAGTAGWHEGRWPRSAPAHMLKVTLYQPAKGLPWDAVWGAA